MSTQTLIMTVPWDQKRLRRAVETSRAVGATLVMDRTRNAFDTWLSLLDAAGTAPTIVMEDDVQVAPRWRARIEKAIGERPDEVIQFFSIRTADHEHGSRYMAGSTYLMNQCHYLPADTAHDLAEYARTEFDRTTHPTGMDTCIQRWLVARKRRYWLHVPSLVQHEPWTSEINPRRARNRQSYTFEGTT